MKYLFTICSFLLVFPAFSQEGWDGKFEQLGNELPTPNMFRAGDGAPGPKYWQQKADYKIKVSLDDENQRITGSESVTYYNNSPQPLTYLWLQLEQNKRAPGNDEERTRTYRLQDTIPSRFFAYNMGMRTRETGMHITSLTDNNGKSLDYTINKTMLRIDLSQPLLPGKSFDFNVSWWYNLNNRMEEFGRSGFEYFPKDGNYLYSIAQFYPRMAVYDDFEGWQNKQFLGGGEFALTFGDFEVEITTPADHLVAATGELANAQKVLSKEHFEKFELAKKSFEKTVIIASEEEAIAREKSRSEETKTWIYKAENVRDFAFGSSRKFIWDAQAVKVGNKTPLAMSLYPKEGNPLWQKESTRAVVNTLKTYSHHSIDYPYPVATSIHAASIGMEYPMICFNFGRPNDDGTYSDAVKWGMIGVIVHEVGHNFFPMIVNSDERQWAWMDEGLNSFLEYLTCAEHYEGFPFDRGPATTIVRYMKGNTRYIRPIMTNAEQITQLGNNSYGKPAAALNILREVVLGKENFDMAFKTYSERWAFKHPKPADFFRTIEDASGTDLDWFWKGWFYSVDHVDISLDTMIYYRLGNELAAVETENRPGGNQVTESPNQDPPANAKKFIISDSPDSHYGGFRERWDNEKMKRGLMDQHFYQMTFSNKGGLVMPILLEAEFESGKKEMIHIPAEIWRYNENKVSKVLHFDEKVVNMRLDPNLMTADTDTSNNIFPREKKESNFEKFKAKKKSKKKKKKKKKRKKKKD